MENVKIFLFTCVKDGRPFIGKLFESLLSQTNTNFVHFIFDNGSNDPVDDLVCKYKEKVSKLKNPYEVIYEKTSDLIGLNMATKYCIEKCTQPYFIWIDCDNWVDKNFFKYLINSIKKNPNCFLYRTSLVKFDKINGKGSNNFSERRLSTTKQNSASFTFFTRKNRYYYSFFAINKKLYMQASHNNILDIRDFYNDEQVLGYCYLANGKFSFVKKSIGYYLARDDSEAHLVLPKHNSASLFFFNERLNIAKKISDGSFKYYLLINKLFEEYNDMQLSYNAGNIKESRVHFNNLYHLSRKNHFSISITFRNRDFLHWFFALYFKRRLSR